MKKLLFVLPVVLFTLTVNAQQTEDEVYIGKGKTFGNYKGTGIIIPDTDRKSKQINGQTALTGIVLAVGWCEDDCLKISVKKDDGTIVTVGTKDYGFTVSKKIVGKRIIVEGIEPDKLPRERRTVKKEYQKDIQFAATGIMVIN
jgi:hypothetical protein